MTFTREFLTGICLAACVSALVPKVVQRDTTPYTPKYRLSPIDGSKIALPTKEQLEFQDKEIGVLIHFEIATYLSIDGCNNVPTLVLIRPFLILLCSIPINGWISLLAWEQSMLHWLPNTTVDSQHGQVMLHSKLPTTRQSSIIIPSPSLLLMEKTSSRVL